MAGAHQRRRGSRGGGKGAPASQADSSAPPSSPCAACHSSSGGSTRVAGVASARRQAARVVMAVPSRTTLIGWGPGAGLVHGGLALIGVQDVIIRNLHISDAYDHFPAWDPKDNGHGEWNSEYDNITLRHAERVWVDHCTLDDGDRPDSDEPQLLGRPMQRHDGLLDLTRASNHITVSWNHFRHHDKTSLVGGSDRHVEDEGRLNADDVRGILRRGCAEAFAEVDFLGHDRRRYRARWEVRRARGKADGRTQNQTLVLTDLDTQQRLGGTKTETLAEIRTRLGLSFEQFRRSVLLAQGDFASFLRAGARDRAELLERITGTQLYGELSKAAHQRARDEEEALRALEQALAAVAARLVGLDRDLGRVQTERGERDVPAVDGRPRRFGQGARAHIGRAARVIDHPRRAARVGGRGWRRGRRSVRSSVSTSGRCTRRSRSPASGAGR